MKVLPLPVAIWIRARGGPRRRTAPGSDRLNLGSAQPLGHQLRQCRSRARKVSGSSPTRPVLGPVEGEDPSAPGFGVTDIAEHRLDAGAFVNER